MGRGTRAVMGLIVGLALGTAVVAVLARTDRKVRRREQAEDILGMRARVEIPVVKSTAQRAGVVVVPGRHDVLSDSYRTLRNVVTFIQELSGNTLACARYVVVLLGRAMARRRLRPTSPQHGSRPGVAPLRSTQTSAAHGSRKRSMEKIRRSCRSISRNSGSWIRRYCSGRPATGNC